MNLSFCLKLLAVCVVVCEGLRSCKNVNLSFCLELVAVCVVVCEGLRSCQNVNLSFCLELVAVCVAVCSCVIFLMNPQLQNHDMEIRKLHQNGVLGVWRKPVAV